MWFDQNKNSSHAFTQQCCCFQSFVTNIVNHNYGPAIKCQVEHVECSCRTHLSWPPTDAISLFYMLPFWHMSLKETSQGCRVDNDIDCSAHVMRLSLGYATVNAYMFSVRAYGNTTAYLLNNSSARIWGF